MKPQTTEKAILGCLTTFAGMIIAAVLVATCNSCSTPQKLYTNQSGEYLTIPNPNDKMVVFSDYKYLYCINKPQNDSTISFTKKDIVKVRNPNHEALPFGTYLICLDEFRNF